jgi:hypothetical protein
MPNSDRQSVNSNMLLQCLPTVSGRCGAGVWCTVTPHLQPSHCPQATIVSPYSTIWAHLAHLGLLRPQTYHGHVHHREGLVHSKHVPYASIETITISISVLWRTAQGLKSSVPFYLWAACGWPIHQGVTAVYLV